MATTALPARHLSTTKGSCFRTCIASVSRAQLLPRRSRALLQSRQSSSSSSANVIDGAAKANYVTTPIFYVNADPHIGHLHSIVLADVLSRWAQARNRGWSSPPHAEAPTTRAIMCTGTDEHGIKIQKVAEASNVEPLALCDRVSGRFKELADSVGADYTRFIRTTDKDHVQAVEHLWKALQDAGHIYKGSHEGWYSVSDETFYPEAQIRAAESHELSGQAEAEGDRKVMISTETGSVVEWSSEENYKLRLSNFQDKIVDWLESNPQAIVPQSRYQALLDEVRMGLADLSISRPRTRLSWGISVPNDTEHTMYVWIDALTNYLTVSGYPWQEAAKGADNRQQRCWPPDSMVIGKDIIRFHAIYFPAMLMALDLPLPRRIVTHGHWTMNKSKMSKSRGNVANPFKSIERFGQDEVRWFLCRVGGNLSSDADWSEATLLEFHRKQLQGQLGNLVSRILAPKLQKRLMEHAMGNKHEKNGKWVVWRPEAAYEASLVSTLEGLPLKVDGHFKAHEVHRALEAISDAVGEVNEMLQRTEPWSRIACTDEESGKVVYLASEACRIVAWLLKPFMPTKMQQLQRELGSGDEEERWETLPILKDFVIIREKGEKVQPLFPKIE